jgi:hypothetical protein
MTKNFTPRESFAATLCLGCLFAFLALIGSFLVDLWHGSLTATPVFGAVGWALAGLAILRLNNDQVVALFRWQK